MLIKHTICQYVGTKYTEIDLPVKMHVPWNVIRKEMQHFLSELTYTKYVTYPIAKSTLSFASKILYI